MHQASFAELAVFQRNQRPGFAPRSLSRRRRDVRQARLDRDRRLLAGLVVGLGNHNGKRRLCVELA